MMKKSLAAILALVMLLLLSACRGASLSTPGGETEPSQSSAPDAEKMVTMYLVTSQTEYAAGEVVNRTTFTYDEKGRPTVVDRSRLNVLEKIELTYDEYGNIIREVYSSSNPDGTGYSEYPQTWDLTYTDGQLTHAVLNDESQADALDFQYDSEGRLVLISYNEAYTARMQMVWQGFVYDDQGRLTEEIVYKKVPKSLTEFSYSCQRASYGYDENGQFRSFKLSYAKATESVTLDEALTLEYTPMAYDNYYFYFDDAGRLAHVLQRELENYDGHRAGIYSDTTHSFDAQGNLVRVDRGNQNYTEYTYEALELSLGDAQTVKRLQHSASQLLLTSTSVSCMDPFYWELAPATVYHPYFYSPFCYLVPYPQWGQAGCQFIDSQPEGPTKTIFLLAEVKETRHTTYSSSYKTTTQNDYDDFGRLLEHITNDGSLIVWDVELDEYGRVYRMSYEKENILHTSVYSYDQQGRVILLEKYINEQLHNKHVYTYDADGKLLTYELVFSDSLHQKTEYIYENGILVRQNYFENDSQLNYTVYEYDAQGRLVAETKYSMADVAYYTLSYTYSEDGLIRYITDSRKGSVTTEIRDAYGNLLRMETAGTIIEYTYRIVQVPADCPRTNWS